MTIINGWFDWATKIPGPQAKQYAEKNALQGVVLHSAVGSADEVTKEVLDPDVEKSVCGMITYSGELVQYYPVTASCWANGQRNTNVRYMGIEHEGGFPGNESEPLKEAQIEADVRLLKDLAEYKQVGIDFWKRPTTLIEHNEIYTTACPSNRIPWDEIIRRLNIPMRTWLYGNEDAGMEVKGFQLLEWHRGIIINIIGDESGSFPGRRMHNEGGNFVEKEP